MYTPIQAAMSHQDWAELEDLDENVNENPDDEDEDDDEDEEATPAFPADGLEVKIVLARHPNFSRAKKPSVTSPQVVVEALRHLEVEVVESMLAVLLDTKHRIVGWYTAVRGQISQVSVEPADLLRAVLAAGAGKFIVVHNHPSGDSDPSRDDDALTARIAAAGSLLGVQLLDHVIVGEDSYYSYVDHDKLPSFTSSRIMACAEKTSR